MEKTFLDILMHSEMTYRDISMISMITRVYMVLETKQH
jgi:hypothetical protein